MTSRPRFTLRQFIAAAGFAMSITCVLAVICYPTRYHDPDTAVMMSGIPIFIAALCVRNVRTGEFNGRWFRRLYFIAVGMVYVLTIGTYACMLVVRDTWIFEDYYWTRSEWNTARLILNTCLITAVPFALLCFAFLANHMIRSQPQNRPDPAAFWGTGSGESSAK